MADERLTTKIIHGDAVAYLHQLDSESIDLVLTDIPYGISLDDWDVLHTNTNSALGGRSPGQVRLGAGFKRRGKPINGWSRADLERPREYQKWCSTWADELLPVLKPGASLVVCCGRRTLHRAVVAMEDAGFLVRDILAWEKSNAHHRAQSLSKLLRRRGMEDVASEWEGWRLGNLAPYFEPIVWLFKPYTIGKTITDNVLSYGVGAMNADACRQNGRSPGNVLRFDFSDGENKHHEAQKPVALMEYLIRLTSKEGQIVLDPFMGSGSTGVAAIRLGRRFIGIEQDSTYVEVARRRMQLELSKENFASEPLQDAGDNLSLFQ